jgi:periplasmic protein TonB
VGLNYNHPFMTPKKALLFAVWFLLSSATSVIAAPSDTPASAPARLRDLDHLPAPLHIVPPACPESLGAVSDRVVIAFVIDEHGSPIQVTATEGAHPELRTAAATAVTAWKFEPPQQGGKPCQASARQVFVFIADPQSGKKTVVQIPGSWGAQDSVGDPSSHEIFDISKIDSVPRPTAQARPDYPPDLRRYGISGQVRVDFIVDTQGNVRNAYALDSTNPDFEDAAVRAVAKWKFKPGRKGDRAVNVHMQVPIVFSVNGL